MNDIIERLRLFRDARNWGQFHTPKDLAISISVESAELLECFQWRPSDAQPDQEFIEKVRDEAADVLLYLLLFCDALKVDITEAAHAKISRNEKRFPISTSIGIAKPKDITAAS